MTITELVQQPLSSTSLKRAGITALAASAAFLAISQVLPESRELGIGHNLAYAGMTLPIGLAAYYLYNIAMNYPVAIISTFKSR